MAASDLQPLPKEARSAFAWIEEPACRRVMAALEAAQPDCARFVGGCVRDALAGRAVADIDIAVQLTPDQATAALEAAGVSVVPTGVEHGTVTAVVDHRGFEITSLRADVSTDGRRATVRFTDDWDEDWRRRDFTMNAIYVTPDYRLYDPAGGAADLQAGCVRFIGDARARIGEDYLRILRFYRFCAYFSGDGLDAEGEKACAELRQGLRKLSAERIGAEMKKLLRAPAPISVLRAMARDQVLEEIWRPPHDLDAVHRLSEIEVELARAPDPILRLAALFPEGGGALGRRLRLSNQEIRTLQELRETGEPLLAGDEAGLRRALYRFGEARYMRRLMLEAARAGAANAALARLRAAVELPRRWTAPVFPLTGADVMALGVPKGPEVGEILRAAEHWWIAHDFPDEAALRAEVKRLTGG